MRKVALLLIIVLFAACNQESLAPEPEVTPGPPTTAMSGGSEWSESTAAFADYEYYNTCVDEIMHLSGTITIRQHTVTHPDGSQRSNGTITYEDDWRVVGMTSGDVWVLVPGVHGRWVMDLPPGSFAWEYDRFTFVNQNTGVVMDWPTRILLVYNAHGELVVDRIEFDDCNIHGQ